MSKHADRTPRLFIDQSIAAQPPSVSAIKLVMIDKALAQIIRVPEKPDTPQGVTICVDQKPDSPTPFYRIMEHELDGAVLHEEGHDGFLCFDKATSFPPDTRQIKMYIKPSAVLFYTQGHHAITLNNSVMTHDRQATNQFLEKLHHHLDEEDWVEFRNQDGTTTRLNKYVSPVSVTVKNGAIVIDFSRSPGFYQKTATFLPADPPEEIAAMIRNSYGLEVTAPAHAAAADLVVK